DAPSHHGRRQPMRVVSPEVSLRATALTHPLALAFSPPALRERAPRHYLGSSGRASRGRSSCWNRRSTQRRRPSSTGFGSSRSIRASREQRGAAPIPEAVEYRVVGRRHGIRAKTPVAMLLLLVK